LHYTTTLVGGGTTTNIKQINIIPTLSEYDELLNQAQFYQSYVVRKVDYKLRVVTPNVSLVGIRLPTGSSQPLVGLLDVFKVRL